MRVKTFTIKDRPGETFELRMPDSPTRRCFACGERKPADTVHFPVDMPPAEHAARHPRVRYLSGRCRACKRVYQRDRHRTRTRAQRERARELQRASAHKAEYRRRYSASPAGWAAKRRRDEWLRVVTTGLLHWCPWCARRVLRRWRTVSEDSPLAETLSPRQRRANRVRKDDQIWYRVYAQPEVCPRCGAEIAEYNAVVQAGVREGHDRDYACVLVEDCCAALTAEEHALAVKSLSRFCTVTTEAEFSF